MYNDICQNSDTICVCVWPDNMWCLYEDIEQYTWKSDDYRCEYLNDRLTDDEIDRIINGEA